MLLHSLHVLVLLLSAPLVAGESVTLAWDPSASTNVVGYRIHYGFTNGVYPLTVEAGPGTNVAISLPIAGTTHCFVATAYDDMGRESDYSEGVSYTTRGEQPALVDQPLETLEDQPIALPWGDEVGYTADATWFVALPPARGLLTDEKGRPVYAPFQDTNGTEDFVYYVVDRDRSCRVTAHMLVQPVNDPPWAWESDVQTDLNTAVVVMLQGWDPEEDPLSYEVVTPPRHGLLRGERGELFYEPATEFSGLDSFQYVSRDGLASSQPATVWIWVGMPEGTPAAFDLEVEADEDQSVSVELRGRDPDWDPLSFEIVVLPEHGTLVGGGARWAFVPQPDFHGADAFQYLASDGTANSEPATVQFAVAPVNDPPVAWDLDLGTNEDAPLEVRLEASDVDGDTLTFAMLTLPQHGTLVGEGETWVYTPKPDYHGTDKFRYGVLDGLTNSEPATVRITVAPVNDVPFVRGASYEVIEGIARDVVLEADDVDGDPLTFRITQGPAHGTLSGSLPQVHYEPEAGYTGGDRWEFAASDGQLDSTAGVVIVEVLPKAAFETTLTVKPEGGQHWLSWGAVTGARYRLWQRRDMFEGDWVVIQEISAVGPEQETVTVLLPESEGYYRCEVLAY